MNVFHGSTVVVQNPLVSIGRENLDFGKGFYVTDIYGQAERWALVMKLRRPHSVAKVNVYEFDMEKMLSDSYKCLRFDGYNNDWLDFIVNSRMGKRPWLGYDYVEGGVANDRVFDTIENYMAGQITRETALGRLRYEKPNNQICLLNQHLVDKYLSYKECIILK